MTEDDYKSDEIRIKRTNELIEHGYGLNFTESDVLAVGSQKQSMMSLDFRWRKSL